MISSKLIQGTRLNIQWNGTKLKPSLFIISIFLLIWWSPPPHGLTVQAWHLFAIFISTIIAIIVKPLPMGAIGIIALSCCTFTHTLTIKQALTSFSSKIVWLVLIAFILARGFIKTGLGTRFAYYFVYSLGKSTLGLSYGFIITELLLAPFIPSNTARGAGIIFPIVSSVSKEYDNPSIGAFLIKTCFQANIITSAMFMTAMAANPLLAILANNMGYNITWLQWAKAAIVPGSVSLLVLPLIIYKLYPPAITRTPEARNLARNKLAELGKFKFEELLMLGTFLLLLFMWIFGEHLQVDATSAAFVGLSILLISGVLTWDDILNEKNGWNTLIWLTTLLTMTNYLSEFGMITWVSSKVNYLTSGYSWPIATFFLLIIYFYSHYFFASLTAHIVAMYGAFTSIALLSGAPVGLVVLLFSFCSNLNASITHYGTGTAPVYFGAGYVPVKKWWLVGNAVSVVNLVIWVVIGSFWWKMLNFW